MSLEDFVSEHKDCDGDFQTVYASHFDGENLQVKKWAKLMRAFERTGLLKSKSAFQAMVFAPVKECDEAVYTYYFQCLVADGMNDRRRQVVNDLWDEKENRRKVFGGLCRWASKDEIENFFTKNAHFDEVAEYADSGLYWSGDRRLVFTWLFEKFQHVIDEKVVVEHIVNDVDHFLPQAHSYRPAGSTVPVSHEFLEWKGTERALRRALRRVYKRELGILTYLLQSPKFNETVHKHRLPYEVDTGLLGGACVSLALPVVELLVAHGFSFMPGERMNNPGESSLLRKLVYETVSKPKSHQPRRGKSQAKASASLTPHAQLLQMHTKTLLEVSKSLAQLLK